MTRTKATAIGAIAILLWSLLAMFTVGSAPVPPFLLNSLTFGIGGLVGLGWIAFSGGFDQLRGVGWKVYAFGSLGLFGYHFLYFSALRLAPAAEAGLICYLWPLLIVLLSGRPLYANDLLNLSNAFVAAWLPGTEGKGVADVLVAGSAVYGKESPQAAIDSLRAKGQLAFAPRG